VFTTPLKGREKEKRKRREKWQRNIRMEERLSVGTKE
jgi:hypothetical protein